MGVAVMIGIGPGLGGGAPSAASFSVTAATPQDGGLAFNVTVSALSSSGATVTNYSGTVHFTSSDGAATLAANATLTSGTGAFSTILRTGGSQTVTATDITTAAITGTSNAITVVVASQFSIVLPNYQTLTSPFNVVVSALTDGGSTAMGYAGTVAFTSSDGSAVLPANSTLTSGTGTFSVTLKTTGAQSITATDSVATSTTGTVTLVCQDAFTDVNGTLLSDHTMTLGSGWSATTTFEIQSNKAKANASGVQQVVTDSGHNDHTLQATISAADGSGLILAGDFGGSSYAWAMVTAGGQLEVWQNDSSVLNQLGVAVCAPATPFLMTVTVRGSTFTVTVENVTVTGSLLFGLQSTSCGLYSTNGTTATWDNFQVTTP